MPGTPVHVAAANRDCRRPRGPSTEIPVGRLSKGVGAVLVPNPECSRYLPDQHTFWPAKMERKTGFEPATLTLAMCLSSSTAFRGAPPSTLSSFPFDDGARCRRRGRWAGADLPRRIRAMEWIRQSHPRRILYASPDIHIVLTYGSGRLGSRCGLAGAASERLRADAAGP
jgi:hypothetical protein